jgi:hypothetical protein
MLHRHPQKHNAATQGMGRNETTQEESKTMVRKKEHPPRQNNRIKSTNLESPIGKGTNRGNKFPYQNNRYHPNNIMNTKWESRNNNVEKQ